MLCSNVREIGLSNKKMTSCLARFMFPKNRGFFLLKIIRNRVMIKSVGNDLREIERERKVDVIENRDTN